MLATRMNREAWQVRASVDGPIRCVNRNRAGLIVYEDATVDECCGLIETHTLKRVIRCGMRCAMMADKRRTYTAEFTQEAVHLVTEQGYTEMATDSLPSTAVADAIRHYGAAPAAPTP
jgi:hypothetical protein